MSVNNKDIYTRGVNVKIKKPSEKLVKKMYKKYANFLKTYDRGQELLNTWIMQAVQQEGLTKHSDVYRSIHKRMTEFRIKITTDFLKNNKK